MRNERGLFINELYEILSKKPTYKKFKLEFEKIKSFGSLIEKDYELEIYHIKNFMVWYFDFSDITTIHVFDSDSHKESFVVFIYYKDDGEMDSYSIDITI